MVIDIIIPNRLGNFGAGKYSFRLADQALQTGSTESLLNMFAASEQADLQKRLQDIKAKRSFKENDLAAGRGFVKAYISFMHHVEHLYEERHKT